MACEPFLPADVLAAQPIALHSAVFSIVRACFGAPPPPPGRGRVHAGLTPFQQEGVDRLRAIIARYRGAILADSVGLGKTHVARALVVEEVRAGGRVLVTGPAQLERHWRRHLHGMRGWQWLSHTTMSRRGAPAAVRYTLVVADEAHGFRNPNTRRYDAMLDVCANARVLLVTATPVNNSVLDFCHLVRLFAGDDAFAGVGVPDLGAAAKAAAFGGGIELRRVVEAVVVRRTRAVLATTADDGSPMPVRFPRAAPVEMLRYDLEDAYPGMLERLAETLASLRFPAHGGALDRAGIREILRLNLLKRLESSSTALGISLARHAAALDLFIGAAMAGLLFDAGADGDLLTAYCTHGQTALRSVALPPWPVERDRESALAIAREDLRSIVELRTALAVDVVDPKVDRLRVTLLDDVGDDRVLLFTEYRDTATMLWRELVGLGGVALIHGNAARLGTALTTRNAVVDRFAPIANGVRPPPPHQRVRLLISTDVLAEGMNLQDARVVISYDLPWNPVRLAQRIGRIDRLGSPHPTIRTLAFHPDRGIDDLLMLMQRIREKLRAARIVGSDMPRIPAAGREGSGSAGLDGNGSCARGTGRPRRPRRRKESRQRLASFTDLDEVELLRSRLRSARATSQSGRPGRSGPPGAEPGLPGDATAGDAIALAAAGWDEPDVGALWCLRQRDAAWLVFVRDGARPRIVGRAGYRILLELLDRTADLVSAEPHEAWREASLRLARRLLRRLLRRQARLAGRRRGYGFGEEPDTGRGQGHGRDLEPGNGPGYRPRPRTSDPRPAAPDLRFQRGLVYPVEPAAAETAVKLRRWLAARPGGASAEEAAQADRWLEELRAAAPRDPARITVSDSELHVVAGILLVPHPNAASRGRVAG